LQGSRRDIEIGRHVEGIGALQGYVNLVAGLLGQAQLVLARSRRARAARRLVITAPVAQCNPEMDEATRATLATQIARAIKWADLSTDHQHDYVFDPDRMITFEGDTGPYLQYAHARVRSIFRRLGTPWTRCV
jgi:hypothetical protein